MSEAMLTMVLELDVARHKREIAAAFAAARERLAPKPPEPVSQTQLFSLAQSLLSNAIYDQHFTNDIQQASLANAQCCNPYANQAMAQNSWAAMLGFPYR